MQSLLALSVLMLAVRFWAAGHVGFGDSEALYACYALHPQPAYLDHPGLVGLLARALGAGGAPTPERAHVVTASLATLFPWAMALACRATGASWARALVAALVVAVTPEIAVGLFAMTPDLLLAFAWTGALGLGVAGLRARPGTLAATGSLVGAGLLAGVASASKVSGLVLFPVLVAALLAPGARATARTVWPWLGLGLGALVVAPIASFEQQRGWPMLVHRLVDTQAGAAVSLRNLGAVVGGQLAYLGPVTLVLAGLALRVAWRDRGDPVGRLLFLGAVLPLSALLPLCLWSRVAEPHWIAPAGLALVLAAARATWTPSRRRLLAALATGAALTAAAHAWVLVPGLASRLEPSGTDPRLDLANELRGWPEVLRAVRAAASEASAAGDAPGDVVVAGPHWVICAQLEAALGGTWPVGCDTPVRDDFDDWTPRDRWKKAEVVVWVSDTRFDTPGHPSYEQVAGSHVVLQSRRVSIRRDGRAVREFTVTTLGRAARASAR